MRIDAGSEKENESREHLTTNDEVIGGELHLFGDGGLYPRPSQSLRARIAIGGFLVVNGASRNGPISLLGSF